MARIAFDPLATEIVGRLAGSVFQDSTFGMQVRGLPNPRNPQNNRQQLRRGAFGFLSGSWRDLSAPDRLTWRNEAGTTPAALRLFIGRNVNLTLIGQAVAEAFVPGIIDTTPVLEWALASTESLQALITGIGDMVPEGMSLLLLVTADMQAGRLFSAPSMFQPIVFFSAGTLLTAPLDITTPWVEAYGVLRPNRNICGLAALIRNDNGFRVESPIVCTSTYPPPSGRIVDSAADYLIDSDGNFFTAL